MALQRAYIHEIKRTLFRLLNANEISCIRTDLFRDLTSVTLLSLYDNNIRSLANGTFANLRSIKTLCVSRH